MADKYRKMIGNEIQAGTRRLEPAFKHGSQAALRDYQLLRQRRQQLIDLAAKPPPLPGTADRPTFNQLAYSVLLIAIIAAAAIATTYINWIFLAYGGLAVLTRLPSSQMFVAALVSLIIIPISTSLQRNSLASIFSIMTFYFLLIGLIRAGLELRRKT
jgi:hypothetical protein